MKLFLGLLIGFALSSVPILTRPAVFELSGVLASNPNYELVGAGWHDYYLSNDFNIQTASPVFKSLLNQFEGKQVRITITAVK